MDESLETWRKHYQQLLNVEFLWDPATPSASEPVEGPSPTITEYKVISAIKAMKSNKAPGPSGIAIEIIQAAACRP